MSDIRDELAKAERGEGSWDARSLEAKGDLVRIIGYVWDCGDDWCSCTEPCVVAIFENKRDKRFVVRLGLWTGEFHTDGEQGADAELAELRRSLRVADPEMEARIVWQEGVDYDRAEL